MTDLLKRGIVGGAVAKLHGRLSMLGIEVPVGERSDDHYGPGTEAAIQRFQSGRGLPITGVIDDATASALGLAGAQPGSIAGVVSQPDGTPLAGVAVRILQPGVRGDKVVAETRSAADGSFVLPWPAGAAGGLTVRADGSAGKAVSATKRSAAGAAWVRLTVGGEHRGPTRFALLTAAALPALEGVALHTVGDAGKVAELETLADVAGMHAHDVSRLVLAHKLAAATKLDPGVFFALFAQRVPAVLGSALDASGLAPVAFDEAQVSHVLDSILQLRGDNVRAALVASVADNSIANLDLEATTARLHALRLDRIAAKPYRVGKTPFRDVLATTLAAPGHHQVFEAFAAHGATAEFWTQLEKTGGLSAAQLDDLRFTLKTAVLVRNHLPLLKHAQKLRADQAITSPGDLARLDEADWGRLLRQADPNGEQLTFTANLKFQTVDERIDHFARMLADQFEARYPTAAFVGRLANDRGELGLAAPGGVRQFFDSARSFSLVRTHVDRYVKDHGPTALAAVDAQAPVIADLKRLQRIYKLAPKFAHAKAMLAAGHGSAQSVYAAGRKGFVAAMTKAGATPSAARAIYARATHAHATTLALLGNFNNALTLVAPSAVAQPAAAATLATSLAGFPDLQSLFGSTDYCSCQHCRAIHGPAAYLVDILQFLKQRPATAGVARDVLLARRPDLGAIELSCDNTNGVLPYIDLACEVLEDAVAAPTAAALRARQTTGSQDERRANPQFVNDAAYTTLRSAVFPHAAPFDLRVAEVRAFLRQLGVPWHDLLAAFQVPAAGATPASPTDTQIAGERLGFNAAALTLVTTAAPAQPWTHWGLQELANSVLDPRKPDVTVPLATGTWLQVLAFVPIVLHRADLRQRELIQLLATRFINPGGAITIVAEATHGFATCDTGKQKIVGWTPEALSRFTRFVRLWRRLGCTIWDLDKAVMAASVGNNAIDAAAIAQLGRLDQLATRLAVPWDELLGLWSEVDRFNYLDVLDDGERVMQSVYARRFRNATVTQSSTVFVDDPTALAGLLGGAEAIAGISAALGLSDEDIQRIRAAEGLTASTTPLNLANLSVIYRHAILAGALGLSVSELVIAIAVTGINPFASPARTLELVAALDQARECGFTLAELHYLLRHGSAQESGIAVADSTITGWLDDVRRGLARVGAAGGELVQQRISDLVSLDPMLTQQALGVTLPGATSTIAALFADPRLTQRASDGSFTVVSTRASFGGIYDAFVVFGKLRTVLGRWRVTTGDASWLLSNASAVGWLALHVLPASATSTVPIAQLVALRRNVAMQQSLVAPSEARLFDVVLARTGARDAVAAGLAALGGWATADVVALATRFGWSTGAALVAGDTAPRIRDHLAWPRKLGTDVATALGFVTTTVGTAEAQKARQLAKARYPLDRWYAVAGAIQDGLREQKRAALVAWLIANPNVGRGQRWTTVEQLYGACLIDPEMSATAMTTRIKQAAASVQLFVQRCFLQREPMVSVNPAVSPGWDQWAWMKRFRLWEANRKIFLYPENWIDPTQRRAKSPFFSELEAELQQSDLGQDAAEDALLNYLHKLSEVSHLEVCGVCEQNDFGQRLLHVIGRTRKAPHVHYYRRLGSTGVWSPWEKLDVEINSNHILPVYWNRRLHVFWPEFAEKSLPTSSESRTVPTPSEITRPTRVVGAEPSTYWEITLAWTEKRRGRWMPKRQSKHKQLAPRSREQHFVFKAPAMGRALQVDLYVGASHDAQWQLTSGENEPVLLHAGLGNLSHLEQAQHIGLLTPEQRRPALLRSSTLRWDYSGQVGSDPGTVTALSLLEGTPMQDLTVLGRISRARVTVEHQDLQFTSQSPFFVSDARRTFFVTPSFQSTTTVTSRFPSGQTTVITKYTPEIFYHPFVDVLLQELAFGGVDGLYQRALQLNPDQVRGTAPFNFVTEYQPTTAILPRPAPEPPYPTETIDYSHDGAYAAYNWELFFHVPLLIAQRLADNQRFEDALRWFHYIFNPSATTGGEVPKRYWIPRVFFDLSAPDYANQQIERLLQLVSQGDPELTRKIAEWRQDPFDPHLIASSRPVAYQKAVVMQYISTLIAWADQLFRGDTIESINEATQLYLLASELLGPRPQNLRALEPRQARTYLELAPRLDAFSNALVDIENVISIPPAMGPPSTTPLPQLHTFYFCIPPNDKLLAYWDTVADRLFKLRHGLNLEGVARQLALYEPPIDPALLVRAAAAGVDVSTAIAEVDVARPCYRFTTMWQVAHDLCQDVRSLGSSILGALERRDAEDLARVRATQEVAVLEAVQAVKAGQLAEARASRAVIERSRDLAVIRRDYYASREFVNDAERIGLGLSGYALLIEASAQIGGMVAAGGYAVPSFTAGASGFGGSPVVTATLGGEQVGNVAKAAAETLRGMASALQQGAGLANTIGGYQHRRDDWDLQRRTADKEIEQIDRQLIAAEIRIAMAQHELDVHLRQIDDARTNAELLASKFTSKELYSWILSQLSTTYFQSYQLAYDLAKRASKAYAFELGVDPGYIQFGYWDSLHKGLHAGDKLLLDLRRLQAEHLHRNTRELELTKHVSLVQLDPAALIKLRQTGACFINLPEAVFDLDQPGHYLRRLRSVSVTLPCVTGPYAGINATLTLVSHATRRSELPGAQYLPAVDADGVPLDTDARFTRGTGAVQSVALSTGREDAGLFEVNFHDDRYLPFEGLGAISHWRLELPRDCNRFDVSTLADVVLHLRYTARDGGQPLRDAARQAVIAALPRSGTQLLSARSEFPDAWARLFAPTGAGQRLELAVGAQHFPYLASNQQHKITAVAACMLFTADKTYADYQAAAPAARLKLRLGFATPDGAPPAAVTTFAPDPSLGQLPVAPLTLAGPVGPLTLAFAEADVAAAPLLDQLQPAPDGTSHHRLNRDRIDDILILISYQVEARP
jgi:hypothetical protein